VLLGLNIQPSEFLKPAFVILIAWLFAESAKKPEVPANSFALLLLFGSVIALVRQPDFGPDHADRGGLGRAVSSWAGMRLNLGDRARAAPLRSASRAPIIRFPT